MTEECTSWYSIVNNFLLLFQSKDGKTPLHMTALHGRFSRSQTIIQSGKKYFCLFLLFLQCSFLVFIFNLHSEWHCGIAIAVYILLKFCFNLLKISRG